MPKNSIVAFQNFRPHVPSFPAPSDSEIWSPYFATVEANMYISERMMKTAPTFSSHLIPSKPKMDRSV